MQLRVNINMGAASMVSRILLCVSNFQGGFRWRSSRNVVQYLLSAQSRDSDDDLCYRTAVRHAYPKIHVEVEPIPHLERLPADLFNGRRNVSGMTIRWSDSVRQQRANWR